LKREILQALASVSVCTGVHRSRDSHSTILISPPCGLGVRHMQNDFTVFPYWSTSAVLRIHTNCLFHKPI